MSYDTQRRDEKIKELSDIVASRLTCLDDSVKFAAATDLISVFARVTSPEKEEIRFHLITIGKGGMGGGTTTKPGNIILNLRKLVTTLAGGALTIAGALEASWTLVLGALVVWDSIYSGLQVPISEREATIIRSMWLNSDKRQTIAHRDLLALVNEHLERNGRAKISQQELSDSLGILERLTCIGFQPSKGNPIMPYIKARPSANNSANVIYISSDGSLTVWYSGSRAWRNNNPGNIRYTPFAKRHGAIGKAGGFAVFPDYNTGRAALSALLRGLRTQTEPSSRQSKLMPPLFRTTLPNIGSC